MTSEESEQETNIAKGNTYWKKFKFHSWKNIIGLKHLTKRIITNSLYKYTYNYQDYKKYTKKQLNY